MKNYHLTPAARQHLRELKAKSRTEFGEARTKVYLQELHEGLTYAALNQKSLPQREEMSGGTNLLLHHIGSHYAVFYPLGDKEIIVGALLHENRDIPNRLREFRSMAREEIAVLEAFLKKDAP